jgi:hypothetical protein
MRPVEHIAGMHDQIHLVVQRGLECLPVIGEEVVAAAPALDARALGQVEPQVGVRQ